MNKFIEILRVVIYIPFFLFTAIVIGFHIYRPFSFYLVVYDILFVLFMFVLPRIFKDRIYTDEDGMDNRYLFTGALVLISLGYYITEYVYKI